VLRLAASRVVMQGLERVSVRGRRTAAKRAHTSPATCARYVSFCGRPKPLLDSGAIPPSSGCFGHLRWSLRVGYAAFQQSLSECYRMVQQNLLPRNRMTTAW
jgi:hypothetical protein